ncbi:MAG: hypothetical protein ACN6PW_02825 [Pseudomonas kermanshahensis]|uniref:hypothetical protein n=1 Tax=Pseudomonas kermanshahensis TaxID=2745482 RepID=UPI003D12D077
MGLEFVVTSEHKDYLTASTQIDFGDLWTGSDGSKSKNWRGDFSGRPGLVSEMFPAIKIAAARRRPEAIASLLHELRSFWRYLDAFESENHSSSEYERIDSVESIRTIHGLRWLRPIDNKWDAARPEKYRSILSIIQATRQSAGLEPLYWPPAKNPDRVRRTDSPSKEHGIKIIRLLTRRTHQIWKRWADADAMAQQGQSLIGLSKQQLSAREITEADIHATYREVISLTNDPAPIMKTLAQMVGISKALPGWWPKKKEGPRAGRAISIQSDLLPGLYPTSDDLYCLVSLFMARSGWNPTTVFALDCSADELWFRQYGEELVWIHSYKERGREWQDTISPKNHSSHCFQIIQRLLARTEALRQKSKDDISRSALPEVAVRSPWLSVSDSTVIRSLTNQHLLRVREFLANFILSHNSEVGEGDQLPIIKPSDFRDVFAEAAHRGGNYSVFVTQLALGHKNSSTTRRYLRSIAWRKESESSLNALVTEMFDQIEVHRVIDFTLLRATMDGVSVTSEQIEKLSAYRKNRTYSGLGCKSPYDPPEWIDPLHPHDGKSICAQGHRCASCPKGVVFKDSLVHLAKCLVELEWKRSHVGDVRWYESTDCVDLEVIQATLTQWPVEEVRQATSEWKTKIELGEHSMIISAAGIH